MRPDIVGLVILGLCIALFLSKRISTAATGTLGCFLMVLLNVCSFEEAFSGFSSSIVLLMASAMIVGIAMFKTGAALIIGRQVTNWSHGDERTFLMVSCLVAGLLAMFLANTAILAAFIPIIDSVSRSYDKINRLNLVLPVACAVMLGGASTLIGCTPQLTANGLMSEIAGIEMGMWDLTGPGLSLFAIFLVFSRVYGYKNGQRIWGKRPDADMHLSQEQMRAASMQSVDKRKLGIMLVISILMITSYVFTLLPIAMTAMAAALLCIFCGCCSVRDVVKELNWEAVVFLATCLGLANALTVAGSAELIGQGVFSLLGDVTSPMPIFAVLVFFTLLISQFVTNSTAIIIVLPIALSMCNTYDFNHMSFCIGITLAASIACCTPLAAAQITMTLVAGYEFKDYMKYGIPLSLLCYLGILLVVPLFHPLV